MRLPGAPSPTRRRAVVAALLVLSTAACSDGDPDDGEGRLEVEDGSAVVVRQDGKREVVEDGTRLRTGDQVTLREGRGLVDLPGQPELELRAGRGERAGTVLVMGPRPVLEGGDLLVLAPQRVAVSADDTIVEVRGGAARVSRTAGVEVVSYDAEVHLDSAGQERDLPGLRELQIPSPGLLPERPAPLQYDVDDPWDRRFLGDAIELGQRLDALSAGYSQNLPEGEGRTVSFFRDVLPGLVDEPELTPDLLDPERPPGETLIGAAIADLGRRGTFAERWRAVFAFRDQGAAWGLVARDQGVDGGSLIAAVTDAVESSELALAPPPPAGSGGTNGAADEGSSGAGVGDDGGGSGRPSPAGPPRPTRPRPTTTVPPPPPPDEESGGLLPPLLGPIVDPVTDLLSGLVDGLLGGLTSSSR